MATLWMSEYSGVGPGNIQAPIEPVLAAQTVTVATETDSSALQPNTRLVRFVTDTDCHIKFGTSPTATTSDEKLVAGIPEFRWVQAGAGTMKVSVIAAA